MAANNANLRHLRAFVTISDKGSFVRAASVLNLSQPALSQCVRQLEQYVGGALLHRTTRTVHLTSLGMTFLPLARDLINKFDDTMGEVQSLASGQDLRVVISCLPSVESRLMPRVLAVNEQYSPRLKVVIRDSNMKGVTSMLMSGEAEIGIGSSIAEFPDLGSVAFGKDEMHAILPVTSPLARKRTLKWEELVGVPFIAMSRETGLRELVDEAVQERGISLNVVAEISNLATLHGMIEDGLGISALPGLALPRNNHSFLRHRPLSEPRVQRTIRLYWKRGMGLSRGALSILSSLRRCITEDASIAQLPDVEWNPASLNGSVLI